MSANAPVDTGAILALLDKTIAGIGSMWTRSIKLRDFRMLLSSIFDEESSRSILQRFTE